MGSHRPGYFAEYNARRRKVWAEKGLCLCCGGPKPCKPCGDRTARWKARHKSTEVCPECLAIGFHRRDCLLSRSRP